jgi:ribosome biogenesis GTPase A
MEQINWYPGHMKKTRELIAANLKLVDAVVEVCDARIPVSSRNPIIDDLVRTKERVLVLNKLDLADECATREWIRRFRGQSLRAVAMNCMKGEGLKALFSALPPARPLRLMIVGVPNSGKSSLINRLTGRRSAAIGNRPGVTRGKQWLTVEGGIQLLDTPGILWPKFEDPMEGLHLAFCGSIRDEIMDVAELGLKLLELLIDDYPALLSARYGITLPEQDAGGGLEAEDDIYGADEAVEEADSPVLTVMDAIARKRGLILPGKRIDYERTGRVLLDEFRAGKIGHITLERPAIY